MEEIGTDEEGVRWDKPETAVAAIKITEWKKRALRDMRSYLLGIQFSRIPP
jgi:hypothetical protein